ncbi:MAG: sulfide-dependent adenosine diphosphate thiazole synthase [Desulfovibrio sp.]|uniref:sulfide-dependent adenosine diphosphate thiazole synthase n=1 Tax=Desulfovibrio sp. 7SRBS1 TaxID=3378064 RepID=UPI003B4001E4
MQLDERLITEAIITEFHKKFCDSLDLDVAIVGAGPSGLTAAYKLSSAGYKVALFERKLSIGGGMWGGGMTYNFIVVQEEGKGVLEEIGVPLNEYAPGYFTADAVTATTTLASKAALAGTRFFNCMSVEDVAIRGTGDDQRVTGIVINSSPVEIAGLHVDPLVLNCKYLIEATGHDTEVLKTLVRKNGIRLNTPSGGIEGERSMWADKAESTTVDNTREVFPGVYVSGMAANATFGAHRMGPIFGGMLLSGCKVAEKIAEQLKK